MSENKYDEEGFFAKYAQMTRSQQGLRGAGEWWLLKQMMPDFQGQRVLDLGCGYGWHCQYAMEQGAAYVMGVDCAKRMLDIARVQHSDPHIEYVHAAIENLHLPENSFDIVISSLAMHYVANYKQMMTKIHGWLRTGGTLVMSFEHPLFTANGSDWIYDDAGHKLHFPLDHYFQEGKREAFFLAERITKYHRTLTTYLNTLLQLGFVLDQIIEPYPNEEMLEWEGMKDELRRPMMLMIAAHKQ